MEEGTQLRVGRELLGWDVSPATILFTGEGTKAQRGCDVPRVTSVSVAELELGIILPSAQGHFSQPTGCQGLYLGESH